MIYIPIWIFNWFSSVSEDLSKNSTNANFLKWIVDELLAIPELIALVTTNKEVRDQLFSTLWDVAKNPSKIVTWLVDSMTNFENAYQSWRSSVNVILSLAWLWSIIKHIWKQSVKKSAENISKVALKKWKTAGENVVKEIEWLKNWKQVVLEWEYIAGEKPVLKWIENNKHNKVYDAEFTEVWVVKNQHKLSKKENVKLLEKPNWVKEIAVKISKWEVVSKNEIAILWDKRNSIAKDLWKNVSKKQELIANKEIWKLDSLIRKSEDWLNWAKESAKVFEKTEKVEKINNPKKSIKIWIWSIIAWNWDLNIPRDENKKLQDDISDIKNISNNDNETDKLLVDWDYDNFLNNANIEKKLWAKIDFWEIKEWLVKKETLQININSRLNIRDENWNVVWKLKKGESVELNWKITSNDWIIFVWINKNWKDYFVAASNWDKDYIKYNKIS
jgi:hypothetical protein